ncbi:hypothetical protein RJ55_02364 [Drechmeria coniospora]|nr:hypothetical protein RJ55_02364 [Drechmeria coniospora]
MPTWLRIDDNSAHIQPTYLRDVCVVRAARVAGTQDQCCSTLVVNLRAINMTTNDFYRSHAATDLANATRVCAEAGWKAYHLGDPKDDRVEWRLACTDTPVMDALWENLVCAERWDLLNSTVGPNPAALTTLPEKMWTPTVRDIPVPLIG